MLCLNSRNVETLPVNESRVINISLQFVVHEIRASNFTCFVNKKVSKRLLTDVLENVFGVLKYCSFKVLNMIKLKFYSGFQLLVEVPFNFLEIDYML